VAALSRSGRIEPYIKMAVCGSSPLKKLHARSWLNVMLPEKLSTTPDLADCEAAQCRQTGYNATHECPRCPTAVAHAETAIGRFNEERSCPHAT
jgi:hypothetical protein